MKFHWYDDIYKVILDCSSFKPTEGFEAIKYNSLSEKYRTRKQEQVLEVYPKGLIDAFIKEYPVEWLEDGISKKQTNPDMDLTDEIIKDMVNIFDSFYKDYLNK